MTGLPILQLRSLTKMFGSLCCGGQVYLDFDAGEFFTIVGPSGSGKTTLLRMLTGMETPTSGEILLRGKRINDLPANKRPTCMVFQSLALFPHRSVGQNIEFSLKMKGVDPATRKARALELDVRICGCPNLTIQRTSPSAPAANGSAWHWPAPSPTSLTSCSSTSRFRPSTTSSGDAGEGTQGHSPGDRKNLHLHHPQP